VDEIHKLGSVIKDAHTAVLDTQAASSVASIIVAKAVSLGTQDGLSDLLQSGRATGGALPDLSARWSGHVALCFLLEALAGFADACVSGTSNIPGLTGVGVGRRFEALQFGPTKHGVVLPNQTECQCDLCMKGCGKLAWETVLCYLGPQGWGFTHLQKLLDSAASVYTMYDPSVSRGMDLELLRPSEDFILLLQESLSLGIADATLASLNLRFLPYIQRICTKVAGSTVTKFEFGITAKHVRPYIAAFEAMYQNVVGFSATPLQSEDVRDMEGCSAQNRQGAKHIHTNKIFAFCATPEGAQGSGMLLLA
jgi:hypothetical protein